jgi:uncharacterized lipoprotein YajG
MGRMTKRLALCRCVLPLAAALVLAACAMPAATVDDTSRVAAVGRISDIEVQHGYLVVEFPNGRMNVSVDKRALERYRVGDELRIDSYGRPLN